MRTDPPSVKYPSSCFHHVVHCKDLLFPRSPQPSLGEDHPPYPFRPTLLNEVPEKQVFYSPKIKPGQTEGPLQNKGPRKNSQLTPGRQSLALKSCVCLIVIPFEYPRLCVNSIFIPRSRRKEFYALGKCSLSTLHPNSKQKGSLLNRDSLVSLERQARKAHSRF